MTYHSHNHWGIMMFGAVLGVAATVMYYNQGHELSRMGSRVMSKSKQVMDDAVSTVTEQTGYSTASEQ